MLVFFEVRTFKKEAVVKKFENPNTLYSLGKKKWQELRALADGYSKTIVLFLEKFLISTQIKMNEGLLLEDAAEKSLKEIRDDFCKNNIHLSLTMVSKAVEYAVEIWPFGKELAEWYTTRVRENPLSI